MKTVIIGGMAGYAAERILEGYFEQKDFEAYNLAGGYRSMDAIEKAISG